jgi:Transposase DDE domain
MLPEFYHKCLSRLLSPRQYTTLQILIYLIQSHKTIQLEKIAALLPIPIQYESRRKHIQRFLALPIGTVQCIWYPIFKKWLKINRERSKTCYLAIDRTQWQERNLFVVSLIENQRGIPLNWILLPKKGSSNFREQKRLLQSALRLFKGYQIVVLGDREFGNIALASWLETNRCKYVIRTKDNKYIQEIGKEYQLLKSLGLRKGKCLYFPEVQLTKQRGFGRVNLALYWSKKTRKKGIDEGWYLITNLEDVTAAVKAYSKRSGIEAMFKDCKTGGYNLEKCQASEKRLLFLVLIIAIAYTTAIAKGTKIKLMGYQKYICRIISPPRIVRRHSNFWVGLYGELWLEIGEYCQKLVEQLMRLTPNKLPNYQRGLRAKQLIQLAFNSLVTP